MKNRRREKAKDTEEKSLKMRAADALGAAKEVILNSARLVFVGNFEVTVENYKCIETYTPCKIEIETESQSIRLSGENLEIKTITQDMLYVTGFIQSLEFYKGV